MNENKIKKFQGTFVVSNDEGIEFTKIVKKFNSNNNSTIKSFIQALIKEPKKVMSLIREINEE